MKKEIYKKRRDGIKKLAQCLENIDDDTHTHKHTLLCMNTHS